MNDWEESSHGRWGYVKALGSYCDPGSFPRAVSAGEREERLQLDRFPVFEKPLWDKTRGAEDLGKEQRPGVEWDSPWCTPIFFHLLISKKVLSSSLNPGCHNCLAFLSFGLDGQGFCLAGLWKAGYKYKLWSQSVLDSDRDAALH